MSEKAENPSLTFSGTKYVGKTIRLRKVYCTRKLSHDLYHIFDSIIAFKPVLNHTAITTDPMFAPIPGVGFCGIPCIVTFAGFLIYFVDESEKCLIALSTSMPISCPPSLPPLP